MKIHFGRPRNKLCVVIGGDGKVSDKSGRQLSLAPRREITALYGISWRAKAGFWFVGVQFHVKQSGEL